MPDIYRDMCRTELPKLEEYPDNPEKFGTALKLLVDAKQICICHFGFRFDAYMGFCSHQCSYCYARGQNMRYDRWPLEKITVADLDDVKKPFANVFEGKKSPENYNTVEKCIAHKYPIRLGTQTDCFQDPEKKYGITYKFIEEIMQKYDYPYLVCTKSKLVIDPKYLELFARQPKNVAFQFTLATMKQDYLDKIERGAATAQERLECMKVLSDLGYRVICRISPHVPEYMEDLEPFVKALAKNGCKHVISEILRISPILNKVMIKEVGFDVIDHYKKLGVKMNTGYYRYPLDKKIEFQKYLKTLCDKAGMTFATCGDEDPSFHTSDNCCGVDNLENFKGCPMAVYDTAWKVCQKKGNIKLDELVTPECWTADEKELKTSWDKGYFENVLMNFEWDKEKQRYNYVKCNKVMKKVNSLDDDKKQAKETETLFD
jgi:DNA repair photolyase